MKNIILIFMLLLGMTFNGCVSFHEEYKPLYQAKPEIEAIKRTK